MALTPPTNEDLAEIAGRYRLGLGPGDIEQFREHTAALASYDAVERLYEASLPTAGPALPLAGRGGERTGRLVCDHRTEDGLRRPAGRAPGRDQGQHRGGRPAHDERVRHG